jgi:desulfoferrodoxin (superoxide reductase-like protein)
MPRRNRNAHAPAIDADELAAQAAQLTAELGSVHIPVSYPAGEIQLRLGGIPHPAKSSVLIDHFNEWIKEHPGCTVSLIDRKSALAMGVTSHGR